MQIKRISIIGASGGMGSFFKKRLEKKNYKVTPLDKPLSQDKIAKALPETHLLLLAVPVKSLDQVIKLIQDKLRQDTILMDICSIKSSPMQLMLKSHLGPVVGSHPLFGSEPTSEDSLRTALVPGRGEEALQNIQDLLASLSLQSFTCTAEEHDQAMSFIQGLNYVTSISYLAAASNVPEIEKFITPSFNRRLKAAQKMLTSDLELFQNIFEDNPFSQDAVRHFRAFLNLAAAGELEILAEKASWWWTNPNDKGGVP